MLDDDLAVKRGSGSSSARRIGAREVEKILGCSRAVVIKLAQTGSLPAQMIDKVGRGRRRWLFSAAAVRKMKATGTALKRPPRPYRIRTAWRQAFGSIPDGFTVIPRDRDFANISPANLALVPLKTRLRSRTYSPRRKRRARMTRWTRDKLDVLRREFATRSTADLSRELGTSVLSIRCKARKLKLRKSLRFVAEQLSRSRRQPIGTERLCVSDKCKGTVLVKVSNIGTQSQQWRPKHHVVWSAKHGRPVPKGMRVVFRDRNKRNFDAENLELLTRDEVSARAFARFLSYPAPLREAIRLNSKLKREVAFQRAGLRRQAPSTSRVRRAGRKLVRYTPAMDKRICREYPLRRTQDLARDLGVSLLSLRCRARRLGVVLDPESIVRFAAEKAAPIKARALGSIHA